MHTYKLKDLVGKTYFAKIDTGITRMPADDAPFIYTAKKNTPVGTIDSYLLPKQGRENVWFAFLDTYDKPYYVELTQGKTDDVAFASQGVKSNEELLTEENKKNIPLKDFIAKNLKIIIAIVVGGTLLKEPIKNALKK